MHEVSSRRPRAGGLTGLAATTGTALVASLATGCSFSGSAQEADALQRQGVGRVTGLPAATPTTTTVTPTPPAKPPTAYRLKLKGVYQSTNYYCEPASAAMSLATFGIRVSQRRLARKMKTRPVIGTTGNNVERVVDEYLKPRHYNDVIVGDVSDPAILMSKVRYDVGTLRRAPVLQVWMEQLPWNRGRIPGRRIGHAIVAYGYNAGRGTITVFDPWAPTGGTHTLSVRRLAKTLQKYAGMHYIERF